MEDAVKRPKWITENAEGTIARLYIQPNATRSEVIGEHGEGEAKRLKIRIAAPAVDNAANEELLYFLKKSVGIPASQIHLLRGTSSRSKDLLLQGISPESVVERLLHRERKR